MDNLASHLINPKYTYKKPVYIEETKCFFLASGCDIYSFSISNGKIVQCLSGHKYKVTGIRKNPYQESSIISCDVKGNVISWRHSKDENKLFHFKSKNDVFFFHIGPKKNFYIGEITSKGIDLYKYESEKSPRKLLLSSIRLGYNTIAVSENAVCGIENKSFKVVPIHEDIVLNGRMPYYRFQTSNFLTCIACHEVEDIVSVGDVDGRIFIYYGASRNKVSITKLHWHKYPVSDLYFSKSERHLYSGGFESVLVAWDTNTGAKWFKPRLGAPIQYLCEGDDESIVTHENNDITIVGHQMRDVVVKSDCFLYRNDKITIFLPHKLTGSFITPGMPGTLQFFSYEINGRSNELDVTDENFYINLDGACQAPNTTVSNATISDDGIWLVTYDSLKQVDYEEQTLRFWRFSRQTRKWKLNTEIPNAHENDVISLSIGCLGDKDYLCVSCGEDRCVRLWTNKKSIRKKNSSVTWILSKTYSQNNIRPSFCRFSVDNSVVGISFKNSIKIWSAVDWQQISSLNTEPIITSEDILQFEFSSEEYNYVIARTNNYIIAWNMITLEIMAKFDLSSSHVILHPLHGYAYCFLPNSNQVVTLNISTNEQMSSHKFQGDSYVTAAAFIRKGSDNILYYCNRNKEIYSCEKSVKLLKSDTLMVEKPKNIPFNLTNGIESINDNENFDYMLPVKGWFDEKFDQLETSKLSSFLELSDSLADRMLFPNG